MRGEMHPVCYGRAALRTWGAVKGTLEHRRLLADDEHLDLERKVRVCNLEVAEKGTRICWRVPRVPLRIDEHDRLPPSRARQLLELLYVGRPRHHDEKKPKRWVIDGIIEVYRVDLELLHFLWRCAYNNCDQID